MLINCPTTNIQINKTGNKSKNRNKISYKGTLVTTVPTRKLL